jgi:uncharacterized protein (TIRG00374 family)
VSARRIAVRVVLLLLAGVSLYLLLPQLLDVFSSWPELRTLDPWWYALAVFFEAMAFVSLWTLQRIALGTRSWFAVATSQLSGAAAGNVIPGGGAASSAVQYAMLVRAGIPPDRVIPGLAASVAATTAAATVLPVVAALAALGGVGAPDTLRRVAYIGGAGFILLVLAAVGAFAWDRPLRAVAGAVRTAAGWVHQGDRFADLPTRVIMQRDGIRTAVAEHPVLAGLGAIGRWAFDYAALFCVLGALGVRPEPALVLLAYSASSLLTLIPITPGGLGFVEAGLTGLLVLAGVGAGEAAAATLAYRLISFWLPLPCGLVAFGLGRRRYGSGPAPAVSEASSSPS